MTCDVQSLLDANPCFAALSPSIARAVEAQMYCSLLGGNMTCDVQELLDVNPCLAALSPAMAEKLEVQILCSIFNNLDSSAEHTCDIPTLIADSACLPDNPQILSALKLQLLCNIGGLL